MASVTLDPLTDLLQVLRVSGALVLNDEYMAPWSVAVPDSVALARLAGIAPTDRVVAFHLVQRGELELVDNHGVRTEATGGDLLVAFGGSPHVISSGNGGSLVPLETLVNLPRDPHSAITSDAAATTLLCGVFSLGPADRSPLIGMLPSVVRVGAGDDKHFDSLALLLATEAADKRPGSGFAISRILELLCAEALRHIAATAPPDEPGWLNALTDPAVFAVMSAVHQDPGRVWTVRRLADEAALSPSRLTARFRAVLGESPMSYVTRWRMTIASQLLTDTNTQIQHIAEQVGYPSQPSFSRAFRRAYGRAPRDYRTKQPTHQETTRLRRA